MSVDFSMDQNSTNSPRVVTSNHFIWYFIFKYMEFLRPALSTLCSVMDAVACPALASGPENAS